MNTNYKTQSVTEAFQHDCHAAIRHILPPGLRELIRTKFATLWERRPHLLHLAVTEAAALAERTGYPQLFLPALALEKVEAAAAWHSRQQIVQYGQTGFSIRHPRFN